MTPFRSLKEKAMLKYSGDCLSSREIQIYHESIVYNETDGYSWEDVLRINKHIRNCPICSEYERPSHDRYLDTSPDWSKLTKH